MRLTAKFLILLISVGFFACDSQRVYEKNTDMSDNFWHVDSIPTFEFEIPDAGKDYNIYYNIRNSLSYPFHNLYVTYTLEDTLGHVISSDLHNMILFDPVTGKPQGSGLGDIFSHQILALPAYDFDSAGVYRFKVQQFMRRDTLPQILSVGIRVEEAG